MPRKYYRKKRNYRKKPYRNQRRRNYKLALMKSPMPTVYTTKLKYTQIIQIASNIVAGVASVIVFSANGLYQPNITSSDHQPRGYDEIQALYSHYRVLGSKITFRCTNGDSNFGAITGISLQASSSANTYITDYTEDSNTVKRMVGNNDGSSVGVMTYKCAPHKFLGLKYDEDNLRGNVSSNPSEQAYYHIFTNNVGGTTSAVTGEVEIEYLCQFFEPLSLTQS